MTEDKDSLLEQMRKGRQTFEAIYLQFSNNRKFYNSYAFCFYEGEDGKYYNSRIRQIFGSNFITYTVGNKKEVLKLLKRIRSDEMYEKVCTMFFVDRDYDFSQKQIDEDLFVTPCYSIENLYVQRECLVNILQSEFGLNEIEGDCQKCLHDYDSRENEFNNNMLDFNALIFLQRKKFDSNTSNNCAFGSIKTSRMVSVGVQSVTRAKRYEETLKGIIEKLNFKQEELEDAKQELTRQKNFSLNFRGKNQLDFFVTFIKNLKELNETGGYFEKKYNNIHINITANRLSELSQYTITPQVLVEFLKNHKNKMLLISRN